MLSNQQVPAHKRDCESRVATPVLRDQQVSRQEGEGREKMFSVQHLASPVISAQRALVLLLVLLAVTLVMIASLFSLSFQSAPLSIEPVMHVFLSYIQHVPLLGVLVGCFIICSGLLCVFAYTRLFSQHQRSFQAEVPTSLRVDVGREEQDIVLLTVSSEGRTTLHFDPTRTHLSLDLQHGSIALDSEVFPTRVSLSETSAPLLHTRALVTDTRVLEEVILYLREWFAALLALPLEQVDEDGDVLEILGDAEIASLLSAITHQFGVELDTEAVYGDCVSLAALASMIVTMLPASEEKQERKEETR